MSKLDVHTYDGELGKNYLNLVDWDDKNLLISPDFNSCMEEIKEYILTLPKPLQIIGKNIYFILIDDQKNNYDPSNKIKVEDILPRVWRFYRKNDNLDDKFVFMQQFLDISRGTCPQGRAGARLYQLYHMLITDCQQFFKNQREIVDVSEKNQANKHFYESSMYCWVLGLKKN
jgi:hypothetical protein